MYGTLDYNKAEPYNTSLYNSICIFNTLLYHLTLNYSGNKCNATYSITCIDRIYLKNENSLEYIQIFWGEVVKYIQMFVN